MKTHYKILQKNLKALVIVLALTFSSNIHASTSLTFGSWWSNFWGGQRCAKCGAKSHSGSCTGGGNQGGGDSIPLDGGLGILVLGAAEFGIKKVRDGKK